MAPEDVQHLVDIEAAIDDRHLSQVRFGRSRFLRTASLALFGLAAGLVAVPPREAEAAPVPRYCSGQSGCDCCNGCRCGSCCIGKAFSCRQGNHCWTTAVNRNGCRYVYKCCDWRLGNNNRCICRCLVRREC
jgi:hypothetical protein